MNRLAHMLHAIAVSFMLVAWLHPLAASAQQTTSSADDALSKLNPSAAGGGMFSQGFRLPAQNPFERPAGGTRQQADDADSPDSLTLQIDRKWAITSASYAFNADPGFYSFGHNQPVAASWDSVISSGITAYITQSGATTVRMTGNLEMYGQKRDPGAAGDPGGQALTIEWEVARLVPTKLGLLEVAAGRYQQQLLSYAAYPNAPRTDPWPGYTVAAAGFETTLTLPDRNIALSLRYGTEHLPSALDRSHTATFEFSWTW